LQDENQNKIENVWKTWSWNSAIGQISAEELTLLIEKEERIESKELLRDQSKKLRLVDILFHHKLRIFEPLWTVIPNNKAILSILFKLNYNHPYLLNTGFNLNDQLVQTGYVRKPITGRAGSNILIVNSDSSVMAQSQGAWDEDKFI